MEASNIIERYDISIIGEEFKHSCGLSNWYFPNINDEYGKTYRMLRMIYTLHDVSKLFNIKHKVLEIGDKTNFGYLIKVHGSGNKYALTDWKGWYITIWGEGDSIPKTDEDKINTFLVDIDRHNGHLLERGFSDPDYTNSEDEVEESRRENSDADDVDDVDDAGDAGEKIDRYTNTGD